MTRIGASVVALGIAFAAGSAEGQPYGAGMMGRNMMGGYAMGSGMMGGMGGMMSARNRACNADGTVPDVGFRRNSGAPSLSADDVKKFVEITLTWNGNPNLKVGAVKERDADSVTADIVTKDNSLVERLAFDRRTGLSCFVVATK